MGSDLDQCFILAPELRNQVPTGHFNESDTYSQVCVANTQWLTHTFSEFQAAVVRINARGEAYDAYVARLQAAEMALSA